MSCAFTTVGPLPTLAPAGILRVSVAAAQLMALNRALLARTKPEPLPEDFFAVPNHRMARLARDIFADDAVAATMEVCAAPEPLVARPLGPLSRVPHHPQKAT